MPKANRDYKDGLFKMLFGSEEHKEWALGLYNAVSGKNYTDPSLLTFYRIGSSLYMRIRNDVSFIIDDILSMFEHQSTYNPNMPLRMLQYTGPAYEEYLVRNKLNKLGSTLIKLPVPKLVVFYNGTKKEPEETILRLSDALPEGSDPDIEVKVRMININYGQNEELFKKCKPLAEYSWFVHEVREGIEEIRAEQYLMVPVDEEKEGRKKRKSKKSQDVAEGKNKKDNKTQASQEAQEEQKTNGDDKSQETQEEQKNEADEKSRVVQKDSNAQEENKNRENRESQEGQKGEEKQKKDNMYSTILAMAIDRAISKMPEDFVIRSFLLTHLSEVKEMYFEEYDETMARELFREEGRREGREEGRAEEGDLFGRLLSKLLKEKRKKAVKRISKDKVYREKLYRRYGLVEA